MALCSDLEASIRKHAKERSYPDGRTYSSLSMSRGAEIAKAQATTIRAVELAALAQDILPERYARNQRSLTCAQQIGLLRSRVAIVGQGGLGGTVTEILARLGVGELVLVDGDVFEESNLNRQLLATTQTMHKSKSAAARRRVTAINPAVTAIAHREFLTADNAESLLTGAQVVVDCLDNLPARFTAARAARKLKIPMISAAVAGMAGHVTVFFPQDGGLEGIYGDPEQLPAKGAETALGTLPFAVSAIACIECAEVTKILLKQPHTLRNRMLVMDLADNTLDVLELA